MRQRDPQDAEIGKRVRTLRLQRGMSQTQLGDLLGVTFQQIQKYENGSNRIAAGRLLRIAEFLAVPITYFYGGVEEGQSNFDADTKMDFDSFQSIDAVRLVRAYSRIKQRNVQLRLLKLAETIADG